MEPEFRAMVASPDDAELLAPRLHPCDVAAAARMGVTPAEGIRFSFDRSAPNAWTLALGDRVMAMWGVAQLEDGRAAVWCCAALEMFVDHRRFLLRASQRELQRLLEQWPELLGSIDAENPGLKRWVTWLGAELGPPEPGRSVRTCTFRRAHGA